MHTSSAMKTLIAGFGNLLLQDDGFGVQVIKRLPAEGLPPNVEIIEVGTGGIHLVIKLTEGFERLIVVDAAHRGVEAGTLFVFTPGSELEKTVPETDPHFIEPVKAMQMAQSLGVLPRDVSILACEPGSCELGTALTPAVEAAADRAVLTLKEMVTWR